MRTLINIVLASALALNLYSSEPAETQPTQSEQQKIEQARARWLSPQNKQDTPIQKSIFQKFKSLPFSKSKPEKTYPLDGGYKLIITKPQLSSNDLTHAVNLPDEIKEIQLAKPGSYTKPITLDYKQGNFILKSPRKIGDRITFLIIEGSQTNECSYALPKP